MGISDVINSISSRATSTYYSVRKLPNIIEDAQDDTLRYLKTKFYNLENGINNLNIDDKVNSLIDDVKSIDLENLRAQIREDMNSVNNEWTDHVFDPTGEFASKLSNNISDNMMEPMGEFWTNHIFDPTQAAMDKMITNLENFDFSLAADELFKKVKFWLYIIVALLAVAAFAYVKFYMTVMKTAGSRK